MILTPIYRKIFYGLVLIGIVILITMPDVVLGLLFELVHLFFELLFVSFEWIESLFDHIVEDLFHTELHQTQTIVFYVLMGIALIPLFYLWRMLRRLFFRLEETLLEEWELNKIRVTLYWQDMTLINKIKFVAIFASIIYLTSLIFM